MGWRVLNEELVIYSIHVCPMMKTVSKQLKMMFKGGKIKLLQKTPRPTSEICDSEIKLPPQVAKLNSSENFFL